MIADPVTISDPTARFATSLLKDVMDRTPSLSVYLVAQSRYLPDDPALANAALRGQWPAMSEAERELALCLARNVLRSIERDCAAEADRLDTFIGAAGEC